MLFLVLHLEASLVGRKHLKVGMVLLRQTMGLMADPRRSVHAGHGCSLCHKTADATPAIYNTSTLFFISRKHVLSYWIVTVTVCIYIIIYFYLFSLQRN